MHGEVRNACKIFVGSLKANAHFRNLGISGTIRELWFDEKRDRVFSSTSPPDRFWGPLILLYSGYLGLSPLG
jgi:hypothetical protein